MSKAKSFLKNMRFVESLDARGDEQEADQQVGQDMEEDDDALDMENDPAPAAPAPVVDTSDDEILSVMNNYFSHVNQMPADGQAKELQGLLHRLANQLLQMPNGEKALRKALQSSAAKLSPLDSSEPALEAKMKAKKKRMGESAEADKEQESEEERKEMAKDKDGEKDEMLGNDKGAEDKINNYGSKAERGLKDFRNWMTALEGELGRKMPKYVSTLAQDLKGINLHTVVHGDFEEDVVEPIFMGLQMSMDEKKKR